LFSAATLPIADRREPPEISAHSAKLAWRGKGDLGITHPPPDRHIGDREELTELTPTYVPCAAEATLLGIRQRDLPVPYIVSKYGLADRLIGALPSVIDSTRTSMSIHVTSTMGLHSPVCGSYDNTISVATKQSKLFGLKVKGFHSRLL
jgi:hypothetical protein